MNPLLRFYHEPIAERMVPYDTHLHFALKNSIFVQKWTLVKLLG